MKKKTKAVSDGEQDQASERRSTSKARVKLGLDMHYRQVTVTMQEEDGPIKALGKMSHDGFSHWVEKKLQAGFELYSCYEAGASGYWLHRDLDGLGVKNLVLTPKTTGQDQHHKNDRRYSDALADC